MFASFSLNQGLPFHSTIVQKEFTHSLCFFIKSSIRLRQVQMQRLLEYFLFLMFTLKKYFMLKKYFFLNFKVLYVLKTHFEYFNSQVNNLDDMEREQIFL